MKTVAKVIYVENYISCEGMPIKQRNQQLFSLIERRQDHCSFLYICFNLVLKFLLLLILVFLLEAHYNV